MKLSDIKPRNYLFPFFFIVTAFLIVWFMAGLSDNRIGKIVCGAIGVSVEIVAQFVYYYGRKFLRTPNFWHITGSVFLFIIYLAYICVFSIPSAITYFATTTAYYEQQNHRKLYNIELTKDRLKQVNQRIEALNKYLEKESETGYGVRSKDVMDQLSKLALEQDKLTRSLQSTSLTKDNIDKDKFGLLGTVYGIPGNKVVIFIFGAAVFMLYVGLIITSPDSFDKKSPTEVLRSPQEVVSKSAESTSEILVYADALIGDNPNKLNGNETISKRTKINPKQCAKYRSIIEQMNIDGKPVIERRQGGSSANFPKEVILERLKEVNQIV